MAWNYAYNPAIWLPLGTLLLILALAVYCWRRRSVPGALPYLFALLFGALWAGGSVLEYLAVDLADKIAWLKFQAAWQAPAATAVTCFLVEYAWPRRWLTRRNLALLSIVPLLIIGFILTDHLHHLMWQRFTLEKTTINQQLGSGSWIAVAYAYGFVIVNFIVFAWLFRHSPQHRWFVVFMVAGQIALRGLYLWERAQPFRSDLPLDMLGIAFANVMYSVALFGFNILNPVPLARQTAIEQLHDSMLVLDRQGRVASLNPAAERLLGVSGKQAYGQPVKNFLPAYPDDGAEEPLVETGDLEIEIDPRAGQESGYAILSISPLKDWRGMEAGRLLLLHDVTSRKQAEAALDKSREIQRLIFEKSFDGISIYEERPDEDRRIFVDCNDRYCQMAGRSKEELLAIQDTRMIQRNETPTEDDDRSSVLAEQVFSGVFSWIRQDGKQNIIEYNAAPIRVGDRFLTIGVDRDITESRQIQAQILEQQQALSILHERERLAGELHDELAQDLALINLQAQLVSGLLDAGQPEQARVQLQVLARAAREAHVEVRGEIGRLSQGVDPVEGFWGTLRHFTQAFQERSAIEVDLTLPGDLRSISFAPTAELQLLRIVQEAFANIRKHARASHARVTITQKPGCMLLRIEDDGVGFDRHRLPASQESFGLGIMAQRAAEVGGRVEVESKPGKGTTVTVVIPVNGEP